MKKYKVTLTPKTGTSGQSVRTTVEASDYSSAKRLVEVQYDTSKYTVQIQG
jgi:hypothetical protein